MAPPSASGDAERQLWQWFGKGRLKPFHHVIDGLENAPAALVGLLAGANRGMTLVRV